MWNVQIKQSEVTTKKVQIYIQKLIENINQMSKRLKEDQAKK